MAKIAILKDYGSRFEGEQYVVDLDRRRDESVEGDIRCSVCPFWKVPLALSINIHPDGSIGFWYWSWGGDGNSYLHYAGTQDPAEIEPTQEQTDTVNGLFSGRIKWEGLKLAPGGTLQKICPIDVKREEELTGKKIYLA